MQFQIKIKIDPCLLRKAEEENECMMIKSSSSSLGASQKTKSNFNSVSSSNKLSIKPSLTGSYLIDEELHHVLNLNFCLYIYITRSVLTKIGTLEPKEEN